MRAVAGAIRQRHHLYATGRVDVGERVEEGPAERAVPVDDRHQAGRVVGPGPHRGRRGAADERRVAGHGHVAGRLETAQPGVHGNEGDEREQRDQQREERDGQRERHTGGHVRPPNGR